MKRLLFALLLATAPWAAYAEHEAAAMPLAELAVWDFDGTILDGDSTEGLVRDGKTVYAGLLADCIAAGFARDYRGAEGVARFRRDYEAKIAAGRKLEAYRDCARIFAGANVAELEAFCRRRFRETIAPHLFAHSLRRFRELEASGVENHVVSASADFFVQAAAEVLRVPRVRIHGIRMKIREGKLTDEIVEPFPYGDGKTEILRELERTRGGKVRYGFGNSYSTDGPFLKAVAEHGGTATMFNGGKIVKGMTELFACTNLTETVGQLEQAGRQIGTAEPPKCPLPGDWTFDASTSDEFDGDDLDRAKWWDYLPHYVGRMTFFNHGRNVKVKDGCLELWTVEETDPAKMPYGWLEEGRAPFSSAVVKSRKKVWGGYFECRMKMNTAPVRGAFWLYDPLSDQLWRKYAPGEYSEEIDICEVEGRHQAEDAGKPYLVNNMTHHYVTPYYEGVCNKVNVPYGRKNFIDEDLSADFHTYGFYWGQEDLVWYLDGKETYRLKHNNTSYGGFYRPLHVVLDSEIVDWFLSRCIEHPIDRRLLPSVQKVDWVRHWIEKQ